MYLQYQIASTCKFVSFRVDFESERLKGSPHVAAARALYVWFLYILLPFRTDSFSYLSEVYWHSANTLNW